MVSIVKIFYFIFKKKTKLVQLNWYWRESKLKPRGRAHSQVSIVKINDTCTCHRVGRWRNHHCKTRNTFFSNGHTHSS